MTDKNATTNHPKQTIERRDIQKSRHFQNAYDRMGQEIEDNLVLIAEQQAIKTHQNERLEILENNYAKEKQETYLRITKLQEKIKSSDKDLGGIQAELTKLQQKKEKDTDDHDVSLFFPVWRVIYTFFYHLFGFKTRYEKLKENIKSTQMRLDLASEALHQDSLLVPRFRNYLTKIQNTYQTDQKELNIKIKSTIHSIDELEQKNIKLKQEQDNLKDQMSLHKESQAIVEQTVQQLMSACSEYHKRNYFELTEHSDIRPVAKALHIFLIDPNHITLEILFNTLMKHPNYEKHSEFKKLVNDVKSIYPDIEKGITDSSDAEGETDSESGTEHVTLHG